MIRSLGCFLFLWTTGCAIGQAPAALDEAKVLAIGQEQNHCARKYGSAARASIASATHFVCRLEVDDPGGGLTDLFNKWKAEQIHARKSTSKKVGIQTITARWEKSARQYNEGKCPKELVGHIIPVNGKIVCESTEFMRDIYNISE
ncbi:MAG: hypothetical protein KF799_10115 [Bdellovibrionales bacterium]|nr:hypothetical protein [Bdellovibrionales bacterium]